MALDIIARSAAAAARNDAAAAFGRADALDLFVNIGSRTVDSSITRLVSRGYDTAGNGSALYVNDSLADATLAAAHPRFCKVTSNGRYFRLSGTFISVEQAGAKGTGNDQPAIQAAVAYAAAAGIREVRFTRATYTSWQPTFPGGSPAATGGVHILVTADVALIGAEGGTTITLKGQGGVARTYLDGNSAWGAGWLHYQGSAITASVLRDITVDGGVTFSNVFSNGESNIYQKGVLIADAYAPNLVRVDHRNVTLCNFAGEIWYMGGGYDTATVYVENLTLYNSPQSAWNAAALARIVAVNLNAYNAYQAAETISGQGHTYIGGRFGKSSANSFLSSAFFNAGSYPYWYPNRDPAKPVPWTTFIGTRFEQANASLTSWTRGHIVTVDSTIEIGGYAGHDIDLDIESWCDQQSGNAAVNVISPADLTTWIGSPAAGTIYYPRTSNIDIRLKLGMTKEAIAAFRNLPRLRLYAGFFNRATCRFHVEGTCNKAWEVFGTPVAGFELPLVTVGPTLSPYGEIYPGAETIYPAMGATTAIDIKAVAYLFQPASSGTATITLGNTYAYKHGQRCTFLLDQNSTDRLIKFPRVGNGLALQQDRILYQKGDLLELEYNGDSGKWQEVRYSSGNHGATMEAPVVLSDAAAVTPDFSLSKDFEWTIGGNRTLANPSNAVAGQTGTIRITQDATGSRVIAYGNNWRFPGGAAAGGVLSTAANAVDLLRYTVGSDARLYCRLDKALA